MIIRIRFPTKCNNSDIASRNKYMYLLWSENVDSPALIDSLTQVFPRNLNMECFESAVLANFVSYVPTFFLNQNKSTLFGTKCLSQ